nr:tumor necrosis factor receptor superfamily member 6-like isoform X2 [Manis javanica]
MRPAQPREGRVPSPWLPPLAAQPAPQHCALLSGPRLNRSVRRAALSRGRGLGVRLVATLALAVRGAGPAGSSLRARGAGLETDSRPRAKSEGDAGQLMVTTATNSDLVFEQKQVAPAPESCRPHEYWSSGHCCILCPAGTYVDEPCGSPHSTGVCVKCDTGTFTSFPNGLDSCFLCDLCSSDEEMVVDCTSTSNRVCRCQTGHFYRHKDFFEFCSPCSTCPRGSVALQKCNATADTVCSLPDPLSRHRWFLIGSFLFLLVILVLAFVYAAKPEDGISAGCRCCPEGVSSGSEEMPPGEVAACLCAEFQKAKGADL